MTQALLLTIFELQAVIPVADKAGSMLVVMPKYTSSQQACVNACDGCLLKMSQCEQTADQQTAMTSTFTLYPNTCFNTSNFATLRTTTEI